MVFGPGDIAQAHTKDEWVDLDQVHLAAEAYYQMAPMLGLADRCGRGCERNRLGVRPLGRERAEAIPREHSDDEPHWLCIRRRRARSA